MKYNIPIKMVIFLILGVCDCELVYYANNPNCYELLKFVYPEPAINICKEVTDLHMDAKYAVN